MSNQKPPTKIRRGLGELLQSGSHADIAAGVVDCTMADGQPFAPRVESTNDDLATSEETIIKRFPRLMAYIERLEDFLARILVITNDSIDHHLG